jgi:GTPase SAR1 family protein
MTTNILDGISKPSDRAIIITLCGDSGMGKTSLAALFPKPIFIRAEDGMQAIPADRRPDAFPLLANSDQLWEQMMALIKEKHDYKTLVIDSVTALERLFIAQIIEEDPKKPRSINQAMGGYGAGLQAVAGLHQRVRKAAGVLNERLGMHIVFIAHADTETIELPDQDPYTRYGLRLGKRSVAPYVDDSDVVGFVKLQTFTRGDGERKQAVSTGARLLVTYATANNVSKNRYGITTDLPMDEGVNPLIEYVPSLKKEAK